MFGGIWMVKRGRGEYGSIGETGVEGGIWGNWALI